MQLIDTHVHLNFENFQADLEEVCGNWRQAGVVQLVHACVHPDQFPAMQNLADRFPELSLAVGMHPLEADRWQGEATVRTITDYARGDRRVVAIGEMGLDFYKTAQPESHQRQIAAFTAQLQIARNLDLPVIIHCREAADAMADLVATAWQRHGPVAGVMHCWAGTPTETQRFLDLGFYISFSGVVTFKNARDIHASAQIVPPERLLIETDCPFLAPVPHRGQRNQPAYVASVAERVAHLRQTPVTAIADLTTANARRLFRLPLPAAPPASSG
jgi:TatD DNase family protein